MVRAVSAAALTIAFVAAAGQTARAQTIYEPVRYQYGAQPAYYYGGSDPQVLEYADSLGGCYYRHGTEYNRRGGENDRHVYLYPGLLGTLPRVFSDCFPYRNASAYGYTAADARNDAYLAVPRYFRKSDLLEAAVESPDGARVVPPQAQPRISIRPSRAAGAEEAAPAEPRPILIIPKKALERPAGKSVAVNQ